MISFCMLYDEGKPLSFRSLDDETVKFFKDRPAIRGVIRAVSAIYRKENVDACRAIAIATDLESALKIVTRTPDLSVKAMRYVTREAGVLMNPETGTMMPILERNLVEITDERPTIPAAR